MYAQTLTSYLHNLYTIHTLQLKQLLIADIEIVNQFPISK